MDINTAKQMVIDAGNRLVKEGLIARTWGNVSCRVDEKTFVITPSGRPYDSLTPEQIVPMDIETLAWEGDVKPSGEKGVHAEVYKARPDINFVIHTHQDSASVLSALHCDIRYIPEEAAKIIGPNVPFAGYGLPSSKTLIENVANALKRDDIRTLLMAHHGALCFGEDSEAAFAAAQTLEKVCELQIFTMYKKIYRDDIDSMEQFARGIAQKEFGSSDVPPLEACISRRQGDGFVLNYTQTEKETEQASLSGSSSLSPEAVLHRAVYLDRPDINCIIRSIAPAIYAVSQRGQALKPQVDDFAQIVGVDARVADFDKNNAERTAKQCVKALKGRHAVLIKDGGALCCGIDEKDAEAVEMITEKNSMVTLATILFNVNLPISALHSRLMRFVYLKKYSKQAEK